MHSSTQLMARIITILVVLSFPAASLERDDGGIDSYNCCDGYMWYNFNSNGIAGYDLRSSNDKIIPINIRRGSGQIADLVMYRPGAGVFQVKKFDGVSNWSTAWPKPSSGIWPGFGIGGMDLRNTNDQINPIDFNGDGLTDLIVHRPGTGVVFIFEGTGDGEFTQLSSSSSGFFNWDFKDGRDQVLIIDLNKDNLQDVIIYRPGGRAVMAFLSQGNGKFTKVDAASDLGGWDFAKSVDKIVPLDFNHDDIPDLIIYRPGYGNKFLFRGRGDGTFQVVNTNLGFYGFDLQSSADIVLPGDFFHTPTQSGLGDDVIIYRPSSGFHPIYVFKSDYWIRGHNPTGNFSIHSSSEYLYGARDNSPILRWEPNGPYTRCITAALDPSATQSLFCWKPGEQKAVVTVWKSMAIRRWSSRFSHGSFGIYQYGGVGRFNFSSSSHQVAVLKNAAGDRDALLFWAPGDGAWQYTIYSDQGWI